MEQAPVRLYLVAGIVAASLVIFTGTLSYGIAGRSRRADTVVQQVQAAGSAGRAGTTSTPAAPATGTKTAPVAPPAEKARTEVAAPASGQPAPKGATHLAQPGETLSLIARLYGVDAGAIRTANGLASDLIKVGQPLKIPGAEPLRRHTVAQGDTLWELAARYGDEMQDLLAANPGIDAGDLQVGQQLVIPSKTGTTATAAPAPEAESVAAYAGVFSWPVVAAVSSPFGPRWGRMHSGVDLAANMGEPIKAARDGEVLIVGEVPGYGNTVVLRHQDGTRTLYAHASKLLVKSGQQVQRGEVIALVGSTGHSTGPHLHFEIIVNNRPRDPLALLPHR